MTDQWAMNSYAVALCAVSAVDPQHCAGDVGGLRAGEEDDACGDLLRPAVAAHRGCRKERGCGLFGIGE